MTKTAVKKKEGGMTGRQRKQVKLVLLLLPFMVLVGIFSYAPLFGWSYAFVDYTPGVSVWDSKFVGFDNFIRVFTSSNDFIRVMRNTLCISFLNICFSVLPAIFAIAISQVKFPKFAKMVQTGTSIPNFISWVLVYSLAFSLFSSSGMVNNLLIRLGIYDEPILYLQMEDNVWLTMWLWGNWKGMGWSAIMYIAAITGIDQELYEAAYVDGAGRFRVIWHITVPGLLPTYFVLLLMSVANFLNNGVDQYYVFQNAFNKKRIQVLDLYVYNLGLGSGSYSLATAISILKSLVSLTLLFTVNGLSKAFRGESII